ncbi:MAG: tRNA 2-thiocytidine biosynthesis protein TtcA [Candidatus Heimdallarchaeota archaeon LC_3]|nr:MAG: tRNA 2-thiocytidine biosynthesis protein TtcA [Candidatus Heimdallarchaeota archaeon LC_3]
MNSDKDNFLCVSCYSFFIEKKVKKSIRKYEMFEYGTHIAVGLSGGKDSVVLLHILKKITKDQKIKLSAIIIDEGVENYRNRGIIIALDLVKSLEIPFKLLSYKGLYDTTLDTMVEIKPLGKSSCALCGTFRRKALNFGALSLKADLIATGHNLDDEAQTILMNMLRGDINRFKRSSKQPNQLHKKFIPRIKPILEISQPEVVYYALANNLEYLDEECPYAPQARRNSIKNFLFDQEKKHNGTLINILRMQEAILSSIEGNSNIDKEFFECEVCGDLTDNKNTLICAGCKFRGEMKKKKHLISL